MKRRSFLKTDPITASFKKKAKKKSKVPKLVIGQEAICPDGLGRIVDFCLSIPNQFIQVETYVHDRSCKWAVHNVKVLPLPKGKNGRKYMETNG